jgi:hypothetical protein
LPAGYVETVLVDAEEGITSVQSSFGSIQPPDTGEADDLHGTLTTLLADGADGLTQLRILARRQDRARLAATVRSLDPVARRLERFTAEHAG